MAYNHLLVAIDLSPDSEILIKKAVDIAKASNAKLSLIHVGLNYSDLYSDLLDLSIARMKQDDPDQSHVALKGLAGKIDYPITHILSANGDFIQVLNDVIKKYEADLVVCGHHHDFWSNLMSSAKQLISSLKIDTLIVPLHQDK